MKSVLIIFTLILNYTPYSLLFTIKYNTKIVLIITDYNWIFTKITWNAKNNNKQKLLKAPMLTSGNSVQKRKRF